MAIEIRQREGGAVDVWVDGIHRAGFRDIHTAADIMGGYIEAMDAAKAQAEALEMQNLALAKRPEFSVFQEVSEAAKLWEERGANAAADNERLKLRLENAYREVAQQESDLSSQDEKLSGLRRKCESQEATIEQLQSRLLSMQEQVQRASPLPSRNQALQEQNRKLLSATHIFRMIPVPRDTRSHQMRNKALAIIDDSFDG